MKTPYPYIDRTIHSASNLTAILSALCVATMMIAICLDAGSRLFFNRSIQGVVEYSEFLMVALVYFGLGYAQFTDQHVAVDIIISRLPKRVSLIFEIIGRILACGVILWMTIAASKLAVRSVHLGEARFGLVEVPVWPDRIVIAIGLAILLLELFVAMFSRIKEYRSLGILPPDS